jgi:HEAT repeat protein
MSPDRRPAETGFLHSIATSGQFERLATYLGSNEPLAVRQKAADILSQSVDSIRADDTTELTAQLYTAALTETDDSVRATIIETLIYLDERAVDTLVSKIESADAPTPPTPSPLVYGQWLESDHVELRLVAIAGLGRVGGDQMVPKLAAACTDHDPRIQARALTECGRLGDPRCVDAAVTCLDAADVDVRTAAVRCLIQIGTDDALTPVVALAKTANSQVRHAVINELGTVGSLRVFGLLLWALNSDVPSLQEAAIRSVVDLMVNAPPDESHTVRMTVGTHLQGFSAETLLSDLRTVVATDSSPHRRNGLWLLGQLIEPSEHTDSLTVLIEAIDDADTKAANIAVSQLVDHGDPCIIDRMEAVIKAREFDSAGLQRADHIREQITHKTATDHLEETVEYTRVSDPADYTQKHADQ